MLRDRDEIARRLAIADEELRLLRRATTDLAFAGRIALDRRRCGFGDSHGASAG